MYEGKNTPLLKILKEYFDEFTNDQSKMSGHFGRLPQFDKKTLQKFESDLNSGLTVKEVMSPLLKKYKYDEEIVTSIVKNSSQTVLQKQQLFVFIFQLLTNIVHDITEKSFVILIDGLRLLPFESYPSYFASCLIQQAVLSPDFSWTTQCITYIGLFCIEKTWIGNDADFCQTFGYFISRVNAQNNKHVNQALITFLHRLFCENYSLAKNTDVKAILEFITQFVRKSDEQALQILLEIMKFSKSPVIPVILGELAESFFESVDKIEFKYSDEADNSIEKLIIPIVKTLPKRSDKSKKIFSGGLASPSQCYADAGPYFVNKAVKSAIFPLIPIFKESGNFNDIFFCTLSSLVGQIRTTTKIMLFIPALLNFLEEKPSGRILMIFYNTVGESIVFNPSISGFFGFSQEIAMRNTFIELQVRTDIGLLVGILIRQSYYPLLFAETLQWLNGNIDKVKFDSFKSKVFLESTNSVLISLYSYLLANLNLIPIKQALASVIIFVSNLILNSDVIFEPSISSILETITSDTDIGLQFLSCVFEALDKCDPTNRNLDHLINLFKKITERASSERSMRIYTRPLFDRLSQILKSNVPLIPHFTKLLQPMISLATSQVSKRLLLFIYSLRLHKLTPKVFTQVSDIVRRAPGFYQDEGILMRLAQLVASAPVSVDEVFDIKNGCYVTMMMYIYSDTKIFPRILEMFEKLASYSYDNIVCLHDAGVAFMLASAVAAGFKRTEVEVNGAKFYVTIPQIMFDRFTKLFIKIVSIKCDITTIEVIGGALKSRLPGVAHYAARLIDKCLKKSKSISRECFPVGAFKPITIPIDFDLEMPFSISFDAAIDDDFASGILFTINTESEEIKFGVEERKLYAQIIGNFKATVTISKKVGKGKKNVAIVFTNLSRIVLYNFINGLQNSESDFFLNSKRITSITVGDSCWASGNDNILGMVSRIKLYKGMIAADGIIIPNIQPEIEIAFNTPTLYNFIETGSRFGLAKILGQSLENFNVMSEETVLIILSCLEMVFNAAYVNANDFINIGELFQKLASTPAKLNYSLYKVIYSITKSIKDSELKKLWFQRLVFNFTIWSKSDAQSLVQIIRHFSTLLTSAHSLILHKFRDYTLFGEFLLYFRILFCRLKSDYVHPHELKLKNMTPDEKMQCHREMILFLKRLAYVSISSSDVEFLFACLEGAKDTLSIESFLEIIRDIAPVIRNLSTKFGYMLSAYEGPFEKDVIIMHAMAVSLLENPHVFLMKFASKIRLFDCCEDIHNSILTNLREYPDLCTLALFLAVPLGMVDSTLTVVVACLSTEDIANKLTMAPLWYSAFLVACLHVDSHLQKYALDLIISMIKDFESLHNVFVMLYAFELSAVNSVNTSLLALFFEKILSFGADDLYLDECYKLVFCTLFFGLSPTGFRKSLSDVFNESIFSEETTKNGSNTTKTEIIGFETLSTLFLNLSNFSIYDIYDENKKMLSLADRIYSHIVKPSQFSKDIKISISTLLEHNTNNVNAYGLVNSTVDKARNKLYDILTNGFRSINTELFSNGEPQLDSLQLKKLGEKSIDWFTSIVERTYQRPLAVAPHLVRDRILYNGAPQRFKNRPQRRIVSIFDNKFGENRCSKMKLMSLREGSIDIQKDLIIFTTINRVRNIKFEDIQQVAAINGDGHQAEITFKNGGSLLLNIHSPSVFNTFIKSFEPPQLIIGEYESSFSVILKINQSGLGRSFSSQSAYPVFPSIFRENILGKLRDFSSDVDFNSNPAPLSRIFGKKRTKVIDELTKYDYILPDFFFNFNLVDDSEVTEISDRYSFVFYLREALESKRCRRYISKWIYNLQIPRIIEKEHYERFFKPSDRKKSLMSRISPFSRGRRAASFESLNGPVDYIRFSLARDRYDFIHIAAVDGYFRIFAAAASKLNVVGVTPKGVQFLKSYDVDGLTLKPSEKAVIGIDGVGRATLFNGGPPISLEASARKKICVSKRFVAFCETNYTLTVLKEGVRQFFLTSPDPITHLCISEEFGTLVYSTKRSVSAASIKNGRNLFKRDFDLEPRRLAVSPVFGFVCVGMDRQILLITASGDICRTFAVRAQNLNVFECGGRDFFAIADGSQLTVIGIGDGSQFPFSDPEGSIAIAGSSNQSVVCSVSPKGEIKVFKVPILPEVSPF